MFDIGLSELVLLSVIALVVLGPDKLPGALRVAGLWIGRLRRSFNTIKADIEREVGADEIRRQLRNEAIMEKIKNTRTQVTDGLESVKKHTEAVKRDLSIHEEFRDKSEGTEETPEAEGVETAEGRPARPVPSTETPPPPPPPLPPNATAAARQAPPPSSSAASSAQPESPVPAAPSPAPAAAPAPAGGDNPPEEQK